jgi:hypothetical protein
MALKGWHLRRGRHLLRIVYSLLARLDWDEMQELVAGILRDGIQDARQPAVPDPEVII